MTKQLPGVNSFNVNDLVIRENKNEGVIFRIEKIDKPNPNVITLSKFIEQFPNHKISKKYSGKSRHYYTYRKYVDLTKEKIVGPREAEGGATLAPVLTLKMGAKESKRRVGIINSHYHYIHHNEESWPRGLKHISVLDILAYQAKINRIVQAFAEHLPGDVLILNDAKEATN